MSVAMESVSSLYQSSSGTDIEAIASRGQLPKSSSESPWECERRSSRRRTLLDPGFQKVTSSIGWQINQIANGVQNDSKSSDSDSTNKPIRRRGSCLLVLYRFQFFPFNNLDDRQPRNQKTWWVHLLLSVGIRFLLDPYKPCPQSCSRADIKGTKTMGFWDVTSIVGRGDRKDQDQSIHINFRHEAHEAIRDQYWENT